MLILTSFALGIITGNMALIFSLVVAMSDQGEYYEQKIKETLAKTLKLVSRVENEEKLHD